MESYLEDSDILNNKIAKRGRPRKQINSKESISENDLSNKRTLRARKQINSKESISENDLSNKRTLRARKQINSKESISGNDLSIKRILRARKQINLNESISESGSDLSIKRNLRSKNQTSQTKKVLRSNLNKTIETTKPNSKKSFPITKLTRSVAKLINNLSDDKSNDSDATLIDTKFNNTTDDEIDNLSELINDEESNDENQAQLNIKSDKEELTKLKENLNKRKFSQLNDNQNNYELNQKKQKNEYFYVFIELQITGIRKNEDIIKFCAYVDRSKKMAYYIFPKRRRLIKKISELTKIWIGNQMMTDNDLICNYEDLLTVLSEFVKLIEEINNDKIILVFENSFHLQYLKYILLNNLRDLDLLDKIENKLAGFIDCCELFGGEQFVLELEAKNLQIKCDLSTHDPLYRLNLLIRLFYSKFNHVLKNQDKVIENYETVKEIADGYFDYYIRKKNQLDDDEYSNLETMDDILKEAKTIIETKDSLTSEEELNLFLIQKHQYQYINSITYKPYRSCPRDKPRNKNQEPDEFEKAINHTNVKNSMSNILIKIQDNEIILDNDDDLENDNLENSFENDQEISVIQYTNFISDDDLISESNNSDSEFSVHTNMDTSAETIDSVAFN